MVFETVPAMLITSRCEGFKLFNAEHPAGELDILFFKSLLASLDSSLFIVRWTLYHYAIALVSDLLQQ